MLAFAKKSEQGWVVKAANGVLAMPECRADERKGEHGSNLSIAGGEKC